MLPNFRNNGDARHRMNFIPLSVKRILHKYANNADMRTHGPTVWVNPLCCYKEGFQRIVDSRAGAAATLFFQFYFLDAWRMLRRTFVGHEVYFSC